MIHSNLDKRFKLDLNRSLNLFSKFNINDVSIDELKALELYITAIGKPYNIINIEHNNKVIITLDFYKQCSILECFETAKNIYNEIDITIDNSNNIVSGQLSIANGNEIKYSVCYDGKTAKFSSADNFIRYLNTLFQRNMPCNRDDLII